MNQQSLKRIARNALWGMLVVSLFTPGESHLPLDYASRPTENVFIPDPAPKAVVATADHVIILTANGFTPASITMIVGEQVVWQNATGQAHTL